MGRQAPVEAQDRARLALHHVFVVGRHEKGHHRARGAGGRLDGVGNVALAGGLVEVLQANARGVGVLGQVVVAAVGHALELVPAPGEGELHVSGALGVMREVLFGVLVQAQLLGLDAQVHVPVVTLRDPVAVPRLRVGGRNEVLHLHLLELAGAKDEVLRGDLVAEGLADLGNTEGRLLARAREHVGEVGEDALRGLGAQVGRGALPLPTGPSWVLNIRLKARASVKSLEPQLGQTPSILSSRQRSLHLRQSTRGSVKVSKWPEGAHRAGGPRTAASRPTMSSRVWTMEYHQACFTLRSMLTPSGP